MNDIAEKYAKLREELDNKDPLVRYAKLKEELNNKDPVKRYVRIKEEINSIKKESSHKFEENKIRESVRKIVKRLITEQKLNEGLPWEQGLEENWFSDLKATAKKAYIKANPGSKYAKAVKSGEKNAPMTKKDQKNGKKILKLLRIKKKEMTSSYIGYNKKK